MRLAVFCAWWCVPEEGGHGETRTLLGFYATPPWKKAAAQPSGAPPLSVCSFTSHSSFMCSSHFTQRLAQGTESGVRLVQILKSKHDCSVVYRPHAAGAHRDFLGSLSWRNVWYHGNFSKRLWCTLRSQHASQFIRIVDDVWTVTLEKKLQLQSKIMNISVSSSRTHSSNASLYQEVQHKVRRSRPF